MDLDGVGYIFAALTNKDTPVNALSATKKHTEFDKVGANYSTQTLEQDGTGTLRLACASSGNFSEVKTANYADCRLRLCDDTNFANGQVLNITQKQMGLIVFAAKDLAKLESIAGLTLSDDGLSADAVQNLMASYEVTYFAKNITIKGAISASDPYPNDSCS